MKILLIQSYVGKGVPLVYPLGLSCLASCLPTHEIRILDLNLFKDPYERLQKDLTRFKLDVIGISLRNIDNQDRIDPCYFYEEFEATIRRIKQIVPNISLVTGGPGFSIFAHEIMERNPELDFGVYLEGEESLPELLDNMRNPQDIRGIFYRKNGKVVFTGPRRFPDVKDLPMPRRDLADMSRYSAEKFAVGLETKRGCFLKCSYCNYPFLSGNKVRLRPPADVVDEIQVLKEKYGIDSFMFTDSVFNVPIKRAREICQEIIRRELEVRWSAYFDIRFAEEEFLVLAKHAGCTDFLFSPDAISLGALKELNKGISKADIDRTIALYKHNKDLKRSRVVFFMFLNPPGETFLGFLQNLLFYMRVKFLLRGRGRSGRNWIRIEPNTGVYEMAIKNAMLKPETELLPYDVAGLKDLFYSQPPLNHLDFLILALLRTLRGVKKFVKDKLEGG
jgi:radical SAM superfamily enzyme YgiQ (UPF0313 family)